LAVCAEERLQVVGSVEAREAKAHHLARTDHKSEWDMNRGGSGYGFKKKQDPFCSVLFHKEKITQGSEESLGRHNNMPYFITERKKKLLKEINCR